MLDSSTREALVSHILVYKSITYIKCSVNDISSIPEGHRIISRWKKKKKKYECNPPDFEFYVNKFINKKHSPYGVMLILKLFSLLFILFMAT